MRMREWIVLSAVLLTTVCATGAPPARHLFERKSLTYPLHVDLTIPASASPTPESEARHLGDGVAFARGMLSLEKLRETCSDCEAFVVSNPELRRDAGELRVLIDVSSFVDSKLIDDEIRVPFDRHDIDGTILVELRNELIFAKRDGDWTCIGWHY